MALNERAGLASKVGTLFRILLFALVAHTMASPQSSPAADDRAVRVIIDELPMPSGNVEFVSSEVLLCPVGSKLYQVSLEGDRETRPVYTHPEPLRRVRASADGKRVVVASDSGLTEFARAGTQMKVAGRVVAAKPPFGDLGVGDDGGLAFVTRDDLATVYHRAKADGAVKAVFTLRGAAGATPDPQFSGQPASAAAVDLVNRRVFVAYAGGVVGVSLDPAKKDVHIPLPGPAAEALAVDAKSGGVIVARHAEFLVYDAAGRKVASGKTRPGETPALAVVPGRDVMAVLVNAGNNRPSTCSLVRISDGKHLATVELAADAGGRSVAASPDGARFAAVTGYGSQTVLKIWRLDAELP